MAAAACLVWATLLMYVAVGNGQVTIAKEFFPEGSLPPPVRIYCREDAALNVAIRNGSVVLANADCKDLSQKWHNNIPESFLLNGQTELKPFWLMNAQTFQVIKIPSGGGQKVGLSSTPPINPVLVPRWLQAAREELWTPEKPTRDDGFYQLFVTKDTTLTLNGLSGGVHDGTEVGLSSSPPSNPLMVSWWLQAARQELWTPEKSTRDDGFYQLFVTKDTTLTLNGLSGGVHDGTEVGIYSASPNSGNAIWKITPAPTCFP